MLSISRPGFGVARMPRLSEWMLKRGLREEEPVPQPGPRSTFSWSAGAGEMQSPPRRETAARQDLLWMHRLGIVDFVHPGGFGFVKDRRRVAGFQEHQFSKVPKSAEPWALQTLDLVGLGQACRAAAERRALQPPRRQQCSGDRFR